MATQAKLALSETVDWKKNTFFQSSITLNESNPEKRYLYSLCEHTFEFRSSFFKFCILPSSALRKYCISSFRMTMTDHEYPWWENEGEHNDFWNFH